MRWELAVSLVTKRHLPPSLSAVPLQNFFKIERGGLTAFVVGNENGHLAPVVQRADNTTQWMNHYPADKKYFNLCPVH